MMFPSMPQSPTRRKRQPVLLLYCAGVHPNYRYTTDVEPVTVTGSVLRTLDLFLLADSMQPRRVSHP
jgi:hypothetical protein